MSKEKQHESDSDSLVAALAQRLDSEIQRIGTTARLVLAETRLAASSAGLLLLFVLLSATTLFISWLLLMALVWQGLVLLGLSAITALAILLGVHLFTAAALLFASWRLSRHLAFTHSRRALAKVQTVATESKKPV